MVLATICLLLTILLGISLAVHNCNDEESRKYRLEQRKLARKRRKSPK